MILFSDFDNTIYFEKDEEKTKKNINSLNLWMKNNNLLVITTGRPIFFIREKLQQLGFKSNYIIGSTGAVIVDQNHIIYESIIPQDQIVHIDAYLKQIKSDLYLYHHVDCSNHNAFHSYQVVKAIPDYSLLETITNYINTKKDNPLKIAYEGSGIEAVFDSGILCLVNQGVNKETAIRILLKKFNIAEDQAYMVGDGDNDLGMVSLFKNGYAVSNATKKLTEVAPHRCEDLATLVEHLLSK